METLDMLELRRIVNRQPHFRAWWNTSSDKPYFNIDMLKNHPEVKGVRPRVYGDVFVARVTYKQDPDRILFEEFNRDFRGELGKDLSEIISSELRRLAKDIETAVSGAKLEKPLRYVKI